MLTGYEVFLVSSDSLTEEEVDALVHVDNVLTDPDGIQVGQKVVFPEDFTGGWVLATISGVNHEIRGAFADSGTTRFILGMREDPLRWVFTNKAFDLRAERFEATVTE